VESLTQAEWLQLSKVLRSLYEPYNLDEFPARSLSALSKLVGAEIYALSNGSFRHTIIPRHYTFPTIDVGIAAESFTTQRQQYLAHPVQANYNQSRNGEARAISDFLTEREFHRNEALYAGFFQRFGLEDHILIFFESSTASKTNPFFQGQNFLGFSLGRGRRSFTERDRTILNLMRPHLQQAHQNAATFTQVQQQLTQLDQTLEQVGLIALSLDGKVQWITQQANKLLHQYFPISKPKTSLPDLLQRWLKQQIFLRKQSTEMPWLNSPLCLEQKWKRLIVRFQYHEAIEQIHLLLEEIHTDGFLVKSLAMLGLTKREAEVLFWVAKDQSTPEIAKGLGMSQRTVKKHLEHIYSKFGVQTRLAAVMYALEKLGIVNL
jgi:DNA-binding CsgD family transcriptional regulator